MNYSAYKGLGVINRTPNSFSDKGLSLQSDYFHNQLRTLLSDPAMIPDIGFESTAPFNEAISVDEEKKRFDAFLEATSDVDFGARVISFDTYKVQNFLWMMGEFKKLHPRVSFIFNDVSGVLDEELSEALNKSKFTYIYTFAHIPSRDQVLKHQSFVKNHTDIVAEANQSFGKAQAFFEARGRLDSLILDPGFGFSKNFEQNWELIERVGELHTKGLPLLVGLSKKSFLRKKLNVDDPNQTEGLHLDCIKKIQTTYKGPLLFRVHDPNILQR